MALRYAPPQNTSRWPLISREVAWRARGAAKGRSARRPLERVGCSSFVENCWLRDSSVADLAYAQVNELRPKRSVCEVWSAATRGCGASDLWGPVCDGAVVLAARRSALTRMGRLVPATQSLGGCWAQHQPQCTAMLHRRRNVEPGPMPEPSKARCSRGLLVFGLVHGRRLACECPGSSARPCDLTGQWLWLTSDYEKRVVYSCVLDSGREHFCFGVVTRGAYLQGRA